MLCDTTLNDQQRSVVIDAIHNFCYGKDGESNKSEIIQHYYRILRKILFQCSEKDHDLVLRRSANTLLCLLNIRADHDIMMLLMLLMIIKEREGLLSCE